MNILYKYCDQGIINILNTLELKLPSISDVNDPLECLPYVYCPNDKSAMRDQWLRTFKRNDMKPTANWEEEMNKQFEDGTIQQRLIDGTREILKDMIKKTFLLSVSRESRSTVMWAHYADKHKYGVIGIDFEQILSKKLGIKLNPVNYSKQRPTLNVLEDYSTTIFQKKYYKMLDTKSDEWKYESEYRTVFEDTYLKDLEDQGLACYKDMNGKNTWFLKLNPESIKEIIFGLYADKKLKTTVRQLVISQKLENVKIYQIKESKAYKFSMDKIDIME